MTRAGACLEYSCSCCVENGLRRGRARGESLGGGECEPGQEAPSDASVAELNVSPGSLPPLLPMLRIPNASGPGRVFQAHIHWEGLSSLLDQTLEDRVLKTEIKKIKITRLSATKVQGDGRACVLQVGTWIRAIFLDSNLIMWALKVTPRSPNSTSTSRP